jgi:ketosteroid isomerase-like protein
MRAFPRVVVPGLVLTTALACGTIPAGGKGGEGDREWILAHVHGIFRAYVNGDRDAIRRAHSADWTGFMGTSTGIERGIDDYMANADRSLERFDGTGYEILDTEVQVYGDVAIVFYVAEYRALDRRSGAEVVIPLRSVDIYRREETGWIQSGSHIAPIPERPSWLPDED